MMSILIIEDSSSQRNLLDKMLSRKYKTYQAEDALEGYAALNRNKDISLIMIDYKMPFLNGADFIRKLKKTEQFERIPTILFTSCDDALTYADSINCGATTLLTKPFSMKNIYEILDNYLEETQNV